MGPIYLFITGDDPKLLCRKMSETRQAAAGISVGDRPRRARSIHYQDAITVNLLVIFIGVLMALFILGRYFIKKYNNILLKVALKMKLKYF